MPEVRSDLIKLEGLIRFRAGDTLLSDPELFGLARDPGRLFSDLLRKAQTSTAQTRGASAAEDRGAGEAGASKPLAPEAASERPLPATQSILDKQAVETSRPTAPAQSAPTPLAQEQEREQPEDRTEQSAAGEYSTAASEPAESPTAPASTEPRHEPASDQDEAAAGGIAPVGQHQDPPAQAAAAQLLVSVASEADSVPEIQPGKALPEDVAEQKSDACRPDAAGTPRAGPVNGLEGELVEANGLETEQPSAADPPEDSAAKPLAADAASERLPAARTMLGPDQAPSKSLAGAEAPQATGKSARATRGSDSRPRAPQPASTVSPGSASADQAAAANQAPPTIGPGMAVVAVQTNQPAQTPGQQPSPSPLPAPSANPPVAGAAQGEAARSPAVLHAETQRPARSAAAPPDGSEGDTKAVDRVRFVQRVARAFETLGQNRGPLRLRLHPPELGSLRLEVRVERGVMTARLEAETQTARNLLLDNLPMLRERLAQQDIRLQQFHVDLMDQPPGGTPDRMPEGWGSGRRPGNAQQPTGGEEPTGPESAAGTRLGHSGWLNVVV